MYFFINSLSLESKDSEEVKQSSSFDMILSGVSSIQFTNLQSISLVIY
jgi:hypothetical protein